MKTLCCISYLLHFTLAQFRTYWSWTIFQLDKKFEEASIFSLNFGFHFCWIKVQNKPWCNPELSWIVVVMVNKNEMEAVVSIRKGWISTGSNQTWTKIDITASRITVGLLWEQWVILNQSSHWPLPGILFWGHQK